jgi:hypothetical protein
LRKEDSNECFPDVKTKKNVFPKAKIKLSGNRNSKEQFGIQRMFY